MIDSIHKWAPQIIKKIVIAILSDLKTFFTTERCTVYSVRITKLSIPI